MAYSEPNIDAEGIHVSGYNDIMEYLLERYVAIFGEDVYIGEETKDYQLLSVFAKCVSDMGELVVQDYNSRNPNYATGDSLDLLLPLVSMTRREATPSTVILTLTGTPGTVIPEDSRAVDADGNLWATSASATLDANGEAEVNAICEEDGAIEADAGTITEIFDVIDGWTGVTNENPAVLGTNAETDAEVRLRRRESLALQNNGLYDAIYRAVMGVGSVAFANVYNNDTSSTMHGEIPGHSVCVVYKGLGTAAEKAKVAEAIWKAKAPGVGTYGDDSATYNDPMGNENTINFTCLDQSTAVAVTVNLNTLPTYDSERCTEMIEEALSNTINNLGVGKNWNVTTAYRDIYNAFAGEDCPFVISSVTGQKTGGTSSGVTVECDYDEILSAGTITINETPQT